MLQEMGEAGFAQNLVARSHPVPDLDANYGGPGFREKQDGEAIFQFMFLDPGK
jgi:hypothetical protein